MTPTSNKTLADELEGAAGYKKLKGILSEDVAFHKAERFKALELCGKAATALRQSDKTIADKDAAIAELVSVLKRVQIAIRSDGRTFSVIINTLDEMAGEVDAAIQKHTSTSISASVKAGA